MNKNTVLGIIVVICCIIWYIAKSTSSSNSPVGTYRADMTLLQSGRYSTYVIKGDGTAVVSNPGCEKEYTYWEYLQGGRRDIRVRDDRGGWDYIDFDDEMIYCEYRDYRSNHNGYKYTKSTNQ